MTMPCLSLLDPGNERDLLRLISAIRPRENVLKFGSLVIAFGLPFQNAGNLLKHRLGLLGRVCSSLNCLGR